MFAKHYLVALIGLVLLAAACSQTKPTPLSLPTSTPAVVTPTPSVAEMTATAPAPSPQPTAGTQTTTTPTVTSPPVSSPTVESLPVEPTRTSEPPTPEPAFPPVITLQPVMDNFENVVYLTYAEEAPPWDTRLFVVEKVGRIQVVENGQRQPVPFLDITDRVGSGGSEQGLLSVAFAPDFDTSEVFYVDYTDRRGNTVVARFRLLDRDPPQGDPDSEQRILEIAQPAANHNGGQLQFGPDGYLYIGTGDGGRAGDPWGNAQNPGELLGKMLRIDVSGNDTYRIPSDNPFVGWSDVRSEIWALGLRNPWRFSFDRATNELYIADVGQNSYEEVDFQPASSTGGENYGWDIMEADHCFEPQSGCDTAGLIPPVAEYGHGLGCSITGGYVYRGTRFPQLEGVYFFGDFCSGRIWGLRQAASGEWNMALLLETELGISSFGEDAAGELYVLDYRGGTIYQLSAAP
jgi:glucose/arabinose dehydrogenase